MLQIESRPMRACFFALFVLLSLFFYGPMVFSHIVNLGNCFGAACCTLAAAFFLCNPWISAMLTRLCRHPAGRLAFGLFAALLGLGMLLAIVLSVFLLYAAHDAPSQPPEAIVVLGCKVNGTTPSRMLHYRIDAAYDYLAAHPDTVAVLSGGQGTNESISEAQCMYETLTAKGIPPEQLLCEDTSTNTGENLRNAKAILEQQLLDTQEIAIVSDGYHQLRASMIAEQHGMHATAISAHTEPWILPTYVVREWFAVTHQFLCGK